MKRDHADRQKTDAPSGTQSIDRAVTLLRLISTHSATGARLIDLASEAELVPPTARRILKRLIDHRLVVQDQATQRYRLGMLAFELGLAASQRPPILAATRPSLLRLADVTGDTIYLVVRSGVEAICLERIEGSFPVKTLTLAVGSRLPLGISAGSLALLASLPDAEIDHIIAANRTVYRRFNRVTPERLKVDIAEVRQRGYAIRHDAITQGVVGLGIALPNADGGQSFAAVSVAMIAQRMNERRLQELLQWLRSELALGKSAPGRAPRKTP